MIVRFMVTALTLGLAINQAYSQSFGEILSGGTGDANMYLENYAAPAINSFGVGLADGWYNTAKAHKLVGFDITTSFNIAKIPDEDYLFEFTRSQFQNLNYRVNGVDQTTAMLPTLVGGEAESGSELYIEGNQTINGVEIQDEIAFDVPSGFDLSNVPLVTGVPTPTVNLGIGLVKNTDLKIRFVPQQTVQGYSFKMFGIGVMHDVKQWIPAIKNLPFDLSGFFGTTTMNAETEIDVDTQDGTTRFSGSGLASFKSNATTVQAIISKKLTVFTPYAAVGFNAVKTTFDVSGDYTLENTNPFAPSSQTISDPIDLTFTGAGGARLTLGARLKLLIFTFHYAYTVQKYNTNSFGVGINIR
tara:strand:+ start:660 stop:1733 length:1074 start_codon:yes stop_codon:yes gene_type:complete